MQYCALRLSQTRSPVDQNLFESFMAAIEKGQEDLLFLRRNDDVDHSWRLQDLWYALSNRHQERSTWSPIGKNLYDTIAVISGSHGWRMPWIGDDRVQLNHLDVEPDWDDMIEPVWMNRVLAMRTQAAAHRAWGIVNVIRAMAEQ